MVMELVRLGSFDAIVTGDEIRDGKPAPDIFLKVAEKLNIDPLSKYGMTIKHIPDLVEKSSKASSMKGNAVSLSMEEMETILLEAL